MGFGVIGEGDPDLLGTSQSNNAAAFYGAREVADYTPLTLRPGQSGRITVTFTPSGASGSTVWGRLYVDDFGLRLLTGNEQAVFPPRGLGSTPACGRG
jgi:hypothetical protein